MFSLEDWVLIAIGFVAFILIVGSLIRYFQVEQEYREEMK